MFPLVQYLQMVIDQLISLRRFKNIQKVLPSADTSLEDYSHDLQRISLSSMQSLFKGLLLIFLFSRQIRECLKLDPDHKECFSHYKKVKKLNKQLQSLQDFRNQQMYDECISKAEQVMTTEPDVISFRLRAKSHLCHCHSQVSQCFGQCLSFKIWEKYL